MIRRADYIIARVLGKTPEEVANERIQAFAELALEAEQPIIRFWPGAPERRPYPDECAGAYRALRAAYHARAWR